MIPSEVAVVTLVTYFDLCCLAGLKNTHPVCICIKIVDWALKKVFEAVTV